MPDPFGVSDLRLDQLPKGTNIRRANFETANIKGWPGFGSIWVRSLGGHRAASRFVRSCFQPAKHRKGEVIYQLLPPSAAFEITPSAIAEGAPSWLVPLPDNRDLDSAKLALVTVIDEAEGWVDRDLLDAVGAALGVKPRVDRRSRAISRAMRFAEISLTESSPTKAMKRLVSGMSKRARASESKVWSELTTPTMARLIRVREHNLRIEPDPSRRAEMMRAHSGRRYPHATDEWFDAGDQDRVALHLIDVISRVRGRPRRDVPARTRWDVFNLVDGHFHRRLPLSRATQVVLDHALALVDAEGGARAGIQLGAVSKRKEFMEYAILSLVSPDYPYDPFGRKEGDDKRNERRREREWEASFLWPAAGELLEAHYKRLKDFHSKI
jgi:hypothetical protein